MLQWDYVTFLCAVPLLSVLVKPSLKLRFARVCTYHLSRCMLISFSGSFGGNIVGRICVWRLLGTSDQSEYHWPSFVISCADKCFKCKEFRWSTHIFFDSLLHQPKTKHFKYLPGSDPRHPLQARQICWAVGQLQSSWMWWERNHDSASRKDKVAVWNHSALIIYVSWLNQQLTEERFTVVKTTVEGGKVL